METLTRLVTESLARHGFDRPLDYRRLQGSEYRSESHHSLPVVPSKPGVFELAEEVIDLESSTARVETAPSPALGRGEGAVPGSLGEAKGKGSTPDAASPMAEARRRFVVGQFSEDDGMAFVVDRMLSYDKSTGPGSDFATLLELTPEPPNLNRTHALQSADSSRIEKSGYDRGKSTAPRLNSAIATTIHCSSSFPSGF